MEESIEDRVEKFWKECGQKLSPLQSLLRPSSMDFTTQGNYGGEYWVQVHMDSIKRLAITIASSNESEKGGYLFLERVVSYVTSKMNLSVLDEEEIKAIKSAAYKIKNTEMWHVIEMKFQNVARGEKRFYTNLGEVYATLKMLDDLSQLARSEYQKSLQSGDIEKAKALLGTSLSLSLQKLRKASSETSYTQDIEAEHRGIVTVSRHFDFAYKTACGLLGDNNFKNLDTIRKARH